MTAFGGFAKRSMAFQRVLRRATLACAWLLAWPGLGGATPPITAESIWAAPDGAVQELHSQCGPVQPGRAICYRAVAARHGASPAALDAIDLLQGEGHITGYRAVGRVDLAAALFPFRANQNATLLVVNGEPPLVDADGPALLARMRGETRTGEAAAPPAFPFPGDRFPLEAITVEPTPDGGLLLVLPYELRTCRACPILATLWYSLPFDAAGRFRGFVFARAAGEAAALTDDRTATRVAPGGVVLLRLPANPTTGYVWMIDPFPADGPLRLVWRAYRLSAPHRPGAPGEDLWWLEARRPGTATITMRSLRRWQPDPNPPTRRFVIEVSAP